MKRLLILLFASLFILNSWVNIAKASEDYRICPRDILAISVWDSEDLHAEGLEVREDGKITFPLVGELQVAGLSPGELMQDIVHALNGYINNPKVTVNVIKYHTTRIYVLGEVAKPGIYDLEKQHNLLDAITVAGGYTKDAAKKKVMILSQGATSTPLQANLLEILKKGDMTQNIRLKDGDIVYLTDNHRIDFARDVMPLVAWWQLFQ